MTIRFLTAWNGYPANTVATLDASTERALLENGTASASLVGGVQYQPNAAFLPNSSNLQYDSVSGKVIGIRDTDGGMVPVGSQFAMMLQRGMRNEALVKAIGSSSNTGVAFNQTTGLSASLMTTTFKQEMETDFSAVRMLLLNRAQNSITANTMVVGVSETNATDTSTNMGSPVVNGTAYQQLAPTGTFNGWRAVTWAGASSVAVAASTTVQTFALSDWIGLTSIARADGGARPLLLWRGARDGATQGNWSFNLVNAGSRTASAANRGRTLIVSNAFSDAVATLTGAMSLTTTALPSAPIVRFNRPVLSVWGVGDSTTQNNAQAADGVSSWGWRGCADASTASYPVVWANFGATSQTSANYWATAKAALAAGAPAPSVLVVSPGSVNDNASPNIRTREDQMTIAHDILATARQYGIPYVIYFPLMPYNALTGPLDLIRKGSNTQFQTLAGLYGVQWLDFSALGNGALPEKWFTQYNDGTGAAGDGIHPDEEAFDQVMAPALTAALNVIKRQIFGAT